MVQLEKRNIHMKEKEKIDPIQMLLDPDNYDNIVLYDDKDKPVEFEQIAIIPIEEKTYVILQPVDKSIGIEDDEAFAFEIVQDEEKGDSLQLVEEDALIDRIFDEYNDMFSTQRKK